MTPTEIQEAIETALREGFNFPWWSYVTFAIMSFVAAFLGSYVKRKAENFATREDVGEITNRIETVKLDYAAQLQSIRTDLDSRLRLHGYRYEKEYEVLSDLASLLVAVRDAAKGLRPVADVYSPDESEEDIRARRTRTYQESARDLYLLYETRRPFYPETLYALVKELDQVAWSEAIQYAHRRPDEGKGYDVNYWERAVANAEKITTLADSALEAIRERVKDWDAIDTTT